MTLDLTRYRISCGELHCDKCDDTRGWNDGIGDNQQTIAELIAAAAAHEAKHHTTPLRFAAPGLDASPPPSLRQLGWTVDTTGSQADFIPPPHLSDVEARAQFRQAIQGHQDVELYAVATSEELGIDDTADYPPNHVQRPEIQITPPTRSPRRKP